MISEVLICSQTFSFYSQCSQVVLPKKRLKVPEFCRSDFGYLWLPKTAKNYQLFSPFPVERNPPERIFLYMLKKILSGGLGSRVKIAAGQVFVTPPKLFFSLLK